MIYLTPLNGFLLHSELNVNLQCPPSCCRTSVLLTFQAYFRLLSLAHTPACPDSGPLNMVFILPRGSSHTSLILALSLPLGVGWKLSTQRDFPDYLTGCMPLCSLFSSFFLSIITVIPIVIMSAQFFHKGGHWESLMQLIRSETNQRLHKQWTISLLTRASAGCDQSRKSTHIWKWIRLLSI